MSIFLQQLKLPLYSFLCFIVFCKNEPSLGLNVSVGNKNDRRGSYKDSHDCFFQWMSLTSGMFFHVGCPSWYKPTMLNLARKKSRLLWVEGNISYKLFIKITVYLCIVWWQQTFLCVIVIDEWQMANWIQYR